MQNTPQQFGRLKRISVSSGLNCCQTAISNHGRAAREHRNPLLNLLGKGIRDRLGVKKVTPQQRTQPLWGPTPAVIVVER
jgi:hypothetical protein